MVFGKHFFFVSSAGEEQQKTLKRIMFTGEGAREIMSGRVYFYRIKNFMNF